MTLRNHTNYSIKQIILISNEPTVNNTYKSFLFDEFQYNIDIVEYDDQVMEKVIAFHADLIIIATLRYINLIQKFKINSHLKEVPIIFLSGAASDEQFISAGADDFLCKPTDINNLFEKVRYFLA